MEKRKVDKKLLQKAIEKFIKENYNAQIILKNEGKIRFLLLDKVLRQRYEKNKDKALREIHDDFDKKMLEFYSNYLKKQFGFKMKDMDLFSLFTLSIDDKNPDYLIIEINF